MRRIIEIDDTLDEIIEGVKSEMKALFMAFMNENPDYEEPPDLSDLDDEGAVHEIIDSAVPVYTGEIVDLFYLYGDEFEAAFDNAGIGEKNDDNWPSGWQAAAIYCYIEQEVSEWYEQNRGDLYDEWRSQHPLEESED